MNSTIIIGLLIPFLEKKEATHLDHFLFLIL